MVLRALAPELRNKGPKLCSDPLVGEGGGKRSKLCSVSQNVRLPGLIKGMERLTMRSKFGADRAPIPTPPEAPMRPRPKVTTSSPHVRVPTDGTVIRRRVADIFRTTRKRRSILCWTHIEASLGLQPVLSGPPLGRVPGLVQFLGGLSGLPKPSQNIAFGDLAGLS